MPQWIAIGSRNDLPPAAKQWLGTAILTIDGDKIAVQRCEYAGAAYVWREIAIQSRLEELESVKQRVTYFELIDSGTSGTLTPPNSATVVEDQWGAGVDAVVSAVDNGRVTFETPRTTTEDPVTCTLNAAGAWSLSGTPEYYPVAIVYVADTETQHYADRSMVIQEELSTWAPPSGNYRVVGQYVDPVTGRLTIEYDDSPI